MTSTDEEKVNKFLSELLQCTPESDVCLPEDEDAKNNFVYPEREINDPNDEPVNDDNNDNKVETGGKIEDIIVFPDDKEEQKNVEENSNNKLDIIVFPEN